MIDTEAKIIENRNIIADYFLLKLRPAEPLGKVTPGQFIMLRMPGNEVFLRRPFSIYDYGRGVLTIMYKVVGKGTRHLSMAGTGEKAFVLGPLGNGFRIVERDIYLVVAGGIGFAGVNSLIRKLGNKATVLYGCSSKEETILLEKIQHLNPMVSTLNGSCGFKGNVTELLKKHLEPPSPAPKGQQDGLGTELFVCGPEGMLKSVRDAISKYKTPCQVLIEERMACGLGLCFGCVRKTLDENEPYKRVCKEGPVFDLWQICL